MPSTDLTQVNVSGVSRLRRRGARWLSLLARFAAAVVVAGALVAVGNAPAQANQPIPPYPTGTETMAVEPVPANCPTVAPKDTIWTEDNVKELCEEAVRLAPSYTAERAIKYAFGKLGTPYSQNTTLRNTTHFDCSSFVGRAFRAADGYIDQQWSGNRVNFYPYFGWTGAYVPTGYYNGTRYGYQGTNLTRLQSKADLLPGDIIIIFKGSSPANSAGNAGHAQIYLGGGKVIESSGPVAVDYHYANAELPDEWYFRWGPSAKDRSATYVQGNSTFKIPVGNPGDTVIGNLTVTSPAANGYTTAYPCDQQRPLANNNLFVAGETRPIMVVAKADSQGYLCVYTTTRGHFIWDQVWSGQELPAHVPKRLMDTRFDQPGRPAGLVPSDGVVEIDTGAPSTTVMANVTIVGAIGPGYSTVYPCDQPRPLASLNNYVPGQLTPNFAVAASDAQGKVCVYTSAGAHVIWDQVSETGAFATHNATRKYDSRLDNFGHRIQPGRVITIKAGKPNETVFGNFTVTDPIGAGYTTAWPCAEGKPNTSVNNFSAGETTPNQTAVKADANGEICLTTSEWAHLIWDQVGETDAIEVDKAFRIKDTRAPGIYPTMW